MGGVIAMMVMTANMILEAVSEPVPLKPDVPAPKDIVVLPRQEWEAEQRVVGSLTSAVLREGIPPHG